MATNSGSSTLPTVVIVGAGAAGIFTAPDRPPVPGAVRRAGLRGWAHHRRQRVDGHGAWRRSPTRSTPEPSSTIPIPSRTTRSWSPRSASPARRIRGLHDLGKLQRSAGAVGPVHARRVPAILRERLGSDDQLLRVHRGCALAQRRESVQLDAERLRLAGRDAGIDLAGLCARRQRLPLSVRLAAAQSDRRIVRSVRDDVFHSEHHRHAGLGDGGVDR